MKFNRTQKDLGIIFLWCVFISLLNYFYLVRNTLPPHWDMARHLWTSLNYYGNFKPTLGGISRFVSQYFYYPPFTYIATMPWYYVFGRSMTVAVLSNIQWMLILSFSIYGIGKMIWSRSVGILCAIAILTIPLIAGHLREYQVDVPLTAMVVASVYFLLRSRYFQSPIDGLWLGLFMGFGFMTKWTFGAFIALPFLANALIAIYLDFKDKKVKRIINIIMVGSLIFSIAGIWYYNNRGILKIDFRANAINAGASEEDPQQLLTSLLWMFNRLADIQLFLPLTIFALTGFILSISKKTYFRKNWQIILLIFGTLAIFTKIDNKDVRYVMPYLPFWVLLGVFWIFDQKQKTKKILLITFCVIILINLFTIQIAPFPVLQGELKIGKTGLTLYSSNAYTSHYPEKSNWKIQEILIAAASQKINCPAGIKPKLSIIGGNILKFNDWAFWYYNLSQGNNLEIASDKRTWNNEMMLFYGNSDDVIKNIVQANTDFPGNTLSEIINYQLPENLIAKLMLVNRRKVYERPLCGIDEN